VALTKKEAHIIGDAPSKYNIDQAIRWAQLIVMECDNRLINAALSTQRTASGIGDVHYKGFWLTVVAFFNKYPMLDRHQLGPVVDYIYIIKYSTRYEWDAEAGRRVSVKPEQPNFEMKGRSPEVLLASVEAWHRELNRGATKEARGRGKWESCGIPGFDLSLGNAKKGTARLWKIRELTNYAELCREGREMKHCVYSYANSCARGRTSIWTMTLDRQNNGQQKCVTIEVNVQTKAIVQVKGKCNRGIDRQEMDILGAWASENKLDLQFYGMY